MAINLATSLAAIVRQIPDKVTVTLAQRSTNDTFGSAVEWTARRQPRTSGDIGDMDHITARWELYLLASQTTLPRRGDRIVSGSDTWEITQVERRFGDLLFDCDCYLDKA